MIVLTYIYAYTYVHNTQIHTYTYIHTYVYIHMYACNNNKAKEVIYLRVGEGLEGGYLGEQGNEKESYVIYFN